MASLLQGFEEVQLVKPVGKTVMTVTDSVVRFNKATAEVLNFPAQIKILINDKTRQIAVTPTTAKADNAVKFSKGEGKQTTSVSIKNAVLVEQFPSTSRLSKLQKARSLSPPSTALLTRKTRPCFLMSQTPLPAP